MTTRKQSFEIVTTTLTAATPTKVYTNGHGHASVIITTALTDASLMAASTGAKFPLPAFPTPSIPLYPQDEVWLNSTGGGAVTILITDT